MDSQIADSSSQSTRTLPRPEELKAELLEIPEPPEMPPAVPPPGYDDALAGAVKYIRAKRGGDLVGIILVGSGARRTVTAHSDIDLIVLVKGPADGQEMIRVGDRLVDIRYGEHQTVGEDLAYSPSGAVTPEGLILRSRRYRRPTHRQSCATVSPGTTGCRDP